MKPTHYTWISCRTNLQKTPLPSRGLNLRMFRWWLNRRHCPRVFVLSCSIHHMLWKTNYCHIVISTCCFKKLANFHQHPMFFHIKAIRLLVHAVNTCLAINKSGTHYMLHKLFPKKKSLEQPGLQILFFLSHQRST